MCKWTKKPSNSDEFFSFSLLICQLTIFEFSSILDITVSLDKSTMSYFLATIMLLTCKKYCRIQALNIWCVSVATIKFQVSDLP